MTALAARATSVLQEAGKVPAFVRRDLLVALSYRTAFAGDLLVLLTQVVIFYFVGQMVESSSLPTYAGASSTYLEFVSIGIAVGVFVQLGLGQMARVLRTEQLTGTLESIFVTPTSLTTIQFGSVAYDLVYVPIRTAIFLGFTAVVFGLGFHLDGVLPALALLLVFVPFVWGLGLVGAASVLAFKRGTGVTAAIGAVLTLGSGAYFPLDLLPGWAQELARLNPVAVTLDGMRTALIGGEGWGSLHGDVLVVAGGAAAAIAIGVACFHAALRHERARGTLGLY